VSVDVIWNFISKGLYPAALVVFFFGLTIFIHELGHFLMARRRGMKVERFSIGFGPKIWGWTKDGIDYRVSWIPFGGYVSLPQMAPMEAIEGKTESKAEELPPAAPSARIQVALAGPVMNLALAVVLSFMIWGFGLPMPVNPSVVGWVEPGSAEETAGIQPGDRIVKVDGRKVETWMQVNRAVALSRDPMVRLVIERGEQWLEFTVERKYNRYVGAKLLSLYPEGRPFVTEVYSNSPAQHAGLQVGDKFVAIEEVPITTARELIQIIGERADQPTEVRLMRDGQIIALTVVPQLPKHRDRAMIGVGLGEDLEYLIVRPGPPPHQQFRDVFSMVRDTAYALWHHKETGIGIDSFRGPVGIGTGWWHEIRQGGLLRGIWFAIIINILLAIFNLLPVPVLDGGHIMFAVYEAVLRRPVNARFAYATSLLFAVVLIGFMLYITMRDIRRDLIPERRARPAPAETIEFEPAP
jgi:regulator of sigma E protease